MLLFPDSSFFICFLDDLNDFLSEEERYQYLFFTASSFEMVVGSAVRSEVGWNRVPKYVTDECLIGDDMFDNTRVDPIIEQLRMLLGRGEVEVIHLAKECYAKGERDFKFILDDGTARSLTSKHVPEIAEDMIGTIGLLRNCALNKLYDGEKTISILTCIIPSNFRINKTLVESLITEIQESAIYE